MRNIEIASIQDISKLLEVHQQKSGIVYRGEPEDYEKKLTPGFGRANDSDPKKEWEMLSSWHNKMRELGKNHHIKNHWEILFEAQHYGLKTRLLDWTESPYFALWIACGGYNKSRDSENGRNTYKDGYIYYKQLPYEPLIVDSIGQKILINNYRWEGEDNRPAFDNPIFSISDDSASMRSDELDFDNPHDQYSFNNKNYFDTDEQGGRYSILFVRPAARANPRIASQSGLFSVHCPVNYKFGQKQDADKYKFEEITVKGEIKGEILEYLDSLNMNETTYGFTSPESYARKLNSDFG